MNCSKSLGSRPSQIQTLQGSFAFYGSFFGGSLVPSSASPPPSVSRVSSPLVSSSGSPLGLSDSPSGTSLFFISWSCSSQGCFPAFSTAPKPRIEAHLSSNLLQKADTLVARDCKDCRVFKFDHSSSGSNPSPIADQIALCRRPQMGMGFFLALETQFL